jgi:hypothetical protein
MEEILPRKEWEGIGMAVDSSKFKFTLPPFGHFVSEYGRQTKIDPFWPLAQVTEREMFFGQ